MLIVLGDYDGHWETAWLLRQIRLGAIILQKPAEPMHLLEEETDNAG